MDRAAEAEVEAPRTEEGAVEPKTGTECAAQEAAGSSAPGQRHGASQGTVLAGAAEGALLTGRARAHEPAGQAQAQAACSLRVGAARPACAQAGAGGRRVRVCVSACRSPRPRGRWQRRAVQAGVGAGHGQTSQAARGPSARGGWARQTWAVGAAGALRVLGFRAPDGAAEAHVVRAETAAGAKLWTRLSQMRLSLLVEAVVHDAAGREARQASQAMWVYRMEPVLEGSEELCWGLLAACVAAAVQDVLVQTVHELEAAVCLVVAEGRRPVFLAVDAVQQAASLEVAALLGSRVPHALVSTVACPALAVVYLWCDTVRTSLQDTARIRTWTTSCRS